MTYKVKLIIIGALLVALISCHSKKEIAFLKECEKERIDTQKSVCQTTLQELKDNFKEDDMFYFLGTLEGYHYFDYNYRRPHKSYDKLNRWASMSFTIPEEEFVPLKEKKYSKEEKNNNTNVYFLKDL